MSLRDLLTELSSTDLKDIARAHNIKGFSALNKDGVAALIDLNLQKMDDEVYGEIIHGLTSSQSFLLWLLSKKQNGVVLSNVIQGEFLEKFTRKTYASALDWLMTLGFVFQRWNDEKEDDLLILPPEILPRIRKALKGLAFDQVKKEAPETEKVETLADILLELPNGDLSGFCDDRGLPKSGTKDQLVQRIMGAGLPPEEILALPSKPVLKWACEVLGCKVSGSKEDLQSRIMERMSLVQEPAEKPEPKKRAPKPAPPPPPPPESLIDMVFNILNAIRIDYHGINDELSLAASIATLLMNDTQLRANAITIARLSTSQKNNKKMPDLIVTKGDMERIYVESKYINQTHPTNSTNEAKEQFFNFTGEFGQNSGIFYFYDKDKKMSGTDLENFRKQSRVIYKTLDDSNL